MVASQRCLERARPTPFDAHQFEGRPPHKTQPRASAPPTAPKRASGLLDAGPLPHLEHHRRPHPRPLELGYIPTPLLTHQDNLGSYHKSRHSGWLTQQATSRPATGVVEAGESAEATRVVARANPRKTAFHEEAWAPCRSGSGDGACGPRGGHSVV